MPWNYRTFGKAVRPIHKSDLVEITGDFGCPKRFKYAQDAAADGTERERSGVVSAKTVLGSAVHETLSRALLNQSFMAGLLAGQPFNEERVRSTLDHEIAIACDGRQVDWGKDNATELIAERVLMVMGALRSLPTRVGEVVMVEAGFTVEIDGLYLAGHTDLIYRDVTSGGLALADWKTGLQKPDELELDHGWEAGIYSLAMRHGTFLPREHIVLEPDLDGTWRGYYRARHSPDDDIWHGPQVTCATRWQAERDALEAALMRVAAGDDVPGARTFSEFPERIHVVHLHDYVPYTRKGTKEVKRDEDADHYGVRRGTTVKYVAGDTRGPAWLPVRRQENDIPRLAHRLRTVVGTVRMGRFLDLVGERCKRCSYKTDCLNGGYQLRGDELAELEARLKEAGI